MSKTKRQKLTRIFPEILTSRKSTRGTQRSQCWRSIVKSSPWMSRGPKHAAGPVRTSISSILSGYWHSRQEKKEELLQSFNFLINFLLLFLFLDWWLDLGHFHKIISLTFHYWIRVTNAVKISGPGASSFFSLSLGQFTTLRIPFQSTFLFISQVFWLNFVSLPFRMSCSYLIATFDHFFSRELSNDTKCTFPIRLFSQFELLLLMVLTLAAQ